MVAYITDSENCSVSTSEREKAWHLLAVLLSIGRPARPVELAARCNLFRASPDFVEFLCFIPNSPLFLADDLFVTVSVAGLSAFGEFTKAVVASVPHITLRASGPKKLWDDVVKTYFRKRKASRSDVLLPMAKRRLFLPSENDEGDRILRRIQNAYTEAHVDMANDMSRNTNLLPGDMSIMEFDLGISNKERAMTLLLDYNSGFSSYGFKNIEHIEGEIETDISVHKEVLRSLHTPECQHRFLNIQIDSKNPKPITLERVMACESHLEPALLISRTENSLSWKEEMDDMEFRNKTGFTATPCPEEVKHCNASPLEPGNVSHACEDARSRIFEDEITKADVSDRKEVNLIDFSTSKGDTENLILSDNPAQMSKALDLGLKLVNPVNFNSMMPSLDREHTAGLVESQGVFPSAERAAGQKQPTKSFAKLKTVHRDALTPGKHVLSESLENNKAVNSPKTQEQCKRDQKFISTKHKLKQSHTHNMHAKENRVDSTSIAPKDQLEPKALPNFNSFVIEEEEGSGGYGTVYRARRKNDGKTFAIKCPHVNAHTHHVNNELKMLERFGGRNFVIKYEGSFKNCNSECFILEHVEHDRPEVLKKEIDIFEIQWYGYCMFRALASLHKQGIVHRDVKPGNFLFSRKLSKGYLIDFNLAMDLHQKYSTGSKSKLSYNVSFDHVPLPRTKSAPPTKARKFLSGRSLEAVDREAVKDSKLTIELKNMKKRAEVGHLKVYPNLSSKNIFRSQGADGSGITSTKDVTSTKTPSAERLREPLPCQGRKELISLVQEAMQSPNHDAISIPASQRKRVAAPPGKVDRKLLYLTPMPLYSTGMAVTGAGSLKTKGDGKPKREGPCVGTKGFRSPEVLLRSPHQGSKVDIWSAGVTLLYLMIGKAPFTGDPEQNIKDIAKLRGSEDLWEVAKLHNRESSFPVELFDIQSLTSLELKEWCKVNTKRPDFLELIPRSLFDLIDKCLTVNPRLRISAEEALRHEFFAPCHESLRKQRLLRRGLSLDSGSDHLSHKQSAIPPVKVSND